MCWWTIICNFARLIYGFRVIFRILLETKLETYNYLQNKQCGITGFYFVPNILQLSHQSLIQYNFLKYLLFAVSFRVLKLVLMEESFLPFFHFISNIINYLTAMLVHHRISNLKTCTTSILTNTIQPEAGSNC